MVMMMMKEEEVDKKKKVIVVRCRCVREAVTAKTFEGLSDKLAAKSVTPFERSTGNRWTDWIGRHFECSPVLHSSPLHSVNGWLRCNGSGRRVETYQAKDYEVAKKVKECLDTRKRADDLNRFGSSAVRVEFSFELAHQKSATRKLLINLSPSRMTIHDSNKFDKSTARTTNDAEKE
jgi:hypothetical protein